MEASDLLPDPLDQFALWLAEAEAKSGQQFPNAMSLATVDPNGMPSVRIVLLKEAKQSGFQFYTNYESAKGRDLAVHPAGSLCFYWDKLGRQVRVDGTVEKLSRQESEAYFQSRPRGSQLGAWASPQSREIPDRAFLDGRVLEAEERFSGQELIPVPPNWGGYKLLPRKFEFWQIALNRLHDRFEYLPSTSGWKLRRLAP